MRTVFCFIISLVMLSAQAQDLIVLQNDQEYVARVTSITPRHIHYHLYDQSPEEIKKIRKNKVEAIFFEDGVQQYFVVQPTIEAPDLEDIDPRNTQAMFEKGMEDAEQYYHRTGPLWGTFGATVFYPFVGIFTGAATGAVIVAVPPNLDPADSPQPELFAQSPEYIAGYRKQAQRKKTKQVLKGFGLGVLAQGFIIAIIVALTN
ncbi:MAG: hypothetical protein AAFR61_14440 [Bacteroidota bacterium]